VCFFHGTKKKKKKKKRGFAEETLPMTAPGKEIDCEKWVATNGSRHDEDNYRKPSLNFLEVFVGDFFPIVCYCH